MVKLGRWCRVATVRTTLVSTAVALTAAGVIAGYMTPAHAQPATPMPNPIPTPQPLPPSDMPPSDQPGEPLPTGDSAASADPQPLPLEATDETASYGSFTPPSSVPAQAPTESPNAQFLRLAEHQLSPTTLGLAHAALALRQLNDPNYQRKIGADLVASNVNYLGSMLNVGALYSGSIVRANLAASAMLNKDAALAASLDADISWELPICRVLGVRTNIGFDRFAEKNNLRGYLEGTACLPFTLISTEVRVGYRFGVRPAVIDQALQAPKEFGGVDFGFTARLYRWLTPQWDVDFWTMIFGVALNNYEDPSQPSSASLQFTAAPVSLHRYGRGFGGGTQTHEILRTTIRAMETNPGINSGVVTYEAYRVEAIRLGDKVGLSFALGAARALVGDAVKSNQLITPGGFVGVAVGDLSAYTETRLSSLPRPAIAKLP